MDGHTLDVGDRFCSIGCHDVLLIGDTTTKPRMSFNDYWGVTFEEYCTDGNSYYSKKLIWLPTQPQLQEMSGFQWNDFDEECLKIDEDGEIASKEQAGIMVVMHELHSKKWDKDKWIT